MPAHHGRAEPGAGREQVAVEPLSDTPRVCRRLAARAHGVRGEPPGDLRHLEPAPSHWCGVTLGFDWERLPPRVTALIRARRQQLSTRLAELASKRGLVLFEGRP